MRQKQASSIILFGLNDYLIDSVYEDLFLLYRSRVLDDEFLIIVVGFDLNGEQAFRDRVIQSITAHSPSQMEQYRFLNRIIFIKYNMDSVQEIIQLSLSIQLAEEEFESYGNRVFLIPEGNMNRILVETFETYDFFTVKGINKLVLLNDYNSNKILFNIINELDSTGFMPYTIEKHQFLNRNQLTSQIEIIIP